MAEDLFDKAKAAAASVAEKITSIKEMLWDEEKAEGKINEVTETINKYKFLFTEAGYEVNSLNASLGLPPEISLSFLFLGAVDKAGRKNILSQATESKLVTILLKSLFKASDFAETIKIGEMKLKSINITLGLIPGISITIS